jgi:tetratricopeptide (TPR) repeat protein
MTTKLIEQYKIHPEVIRGLDGQLFLAGGSQRVEDYLFGEALIDEDSFMNFDNNLSERKAVSEQNGAKYLHMVCPDKQSVLTDHYPVAFPISLGGLYKDKCSQDFLFPVSELKEAGPTETYYKTDTHWNFEGSFVAVNAILKEFGLDVGQVPLADRFISSVNENFSGDLGSKLEPKLTCKTKVYRKNQHTLLFSNEFTKNIGLIRVAFNPTAKNERLLIFGDSFLAHCLYAFAEHFKYVLFIRSPYFHSEVFHAFKPTHVVSGNAERYLSRIRPDSLAENFFYTAFLRGFQFNPDNEFYAAFSAITSRNKTGLIRIFEKKLQVYLDEGRYGLVVGMINGWLATESLTERLGLLKSKALDNLGRHDSALEAAIEVLRTGARSHVALCQAGGLCLKTKKYEEAINYFDEAVTLSRASFVPFIGISRALGHMGRLDEAIAYADKAVLVSNGSASVLSYRKELKQPRSKSRKANKFVRFLRFFNFPARLRKYASRTA